MEKNLEGFLKQYNAFIEREYGGTPLTLERLQKEAEIPILFIDSCGKIGNYEMHAYYNFRTEEETVVVDSQYLKAVRKEVIPLDIQMENFEKASYDDFIASYDFNYEALDQMQGLGIERKWGELLEKLEASPYEVSFYSKKVEKNLYLERQGGKYQDREEFLTVVQQDGSALWLGSETLRGDKEIVLEAVQQAGPVLQDANESLQDDRDIVLAAVKQSGFALNFASERLKNDKEIVLEALETFNGAFEYAGERVRNDKEVALVALEKNGFLLRYMSEEFKKDKEVVLAAVKDPPLLGSAFRYADKNLKKDKEFVLKVLKVDPSAFAEIDPSLKKDRKILLSLEEKKSSKIPKKGILKEGHER